MREAWTGEIVAQMHVNKITQGELAKKMCITRTYLNRLLTGAQVTRGTEERCREAVNQIVAERRATEEDLVKNKTVKEDKRGSYSGRPGNKGN